jgi:hypothetical protein
VIPPTRPMDLDRIAFIGKNMGSPMRVFFQFV